MTQNEFLARLRELSVDCNLPVADQITLVEIYKDELMNTYHDIHAIDEE